MKKILILSTIILSASFRVHAQTSYIQWQKIFGGIRYDKAYSIKQTTDGGYIVAGTSYSYYDDRFADYWVLKLSSTGGVQWSKFLGGTGYDEAYSIQQTTDGGYIVAGYTSSVNGDVMGNHGNEDCWVVKLSSTGSIQWQKTLGGTKGDWARSIQQTTDGGYVVAGITQSNNGDVTGNQGYSDYWVVKLSSTGNIQWQKTLGGTNYDLARSIQQTADGGYIVAGTSNSTDGNVTGNHGGYDNWIVKLSSTGSIQWQKTLGGTAGEQAYSIQQTIDGGYIVAGITQSNNGDVTGNHGDYDNWVVKLSSTGSIQWQKVLGGTSLDFASSIQQTTDGGYVLAGSTHSTDGDVIGNHGDYDNWVVKLSSTGSIQWQKTLGGTSYEEAFSIQQTTDGGYILAGITGSNDGDLTEYTAGYDYWVVKLAPETLSTQESNLQNLALFYPNPTKDFIIISTEEDIQSISILDITGKHIFNANKKTKKIDISKLKKGMYLIKIITTNGAIQTEKIIKN